jgi:serine/threonine-protein kinase RsbW
MAHEADQGTCWHISGLEEMPPILHVLEAAMAERGYGPKDIFGMRLAVEEAIVNAIRHGNRRDPAKAVLIILDVSLDGALAEVEDEGSGYDPARVPDPTAPENLERPGGRGLLLMGSYTTWVRHNKRGNRVTLYKRRSAP